MCRPSNCSNAFPSPARRCHSWLGGPAERTVSESDSSHHSLRSSFWRGSPGPSPHQSRGNRDRRSLRRGGRTARSRYGVRRSERVELARVESTFGSDRHHPFTAPFAFVRRRELVGAVARPVPRPAARDVTTSSAGATGPSSIGTRARRLCAPAPRDDARQAFHRAGDAARRPTARPTAAACTTTIRSTPSSVSFCTTSSGFSPLVSENATVEARFERRARGPTPTSRCSSTTPDAAATTRYTRQRP